MSNYTKLVDYAAKDSLSSGTPLKVLSGTEINNDLTEIATAISTKADTANATHTGTSAFAAITANSVVSTTLAGALTGNVTGNLTGNVTGNSDTATTATTATTAATVTTAAQPAITSVGTLTSLAVSGTVDGRDVSVDGAKLDLLGSSNVVLNTKVIAIGYWDMTFESSKSVVHGLSDRTKIRTVSAIIYRDDGAFYFDMNWESTFGTDGHNGIAVGTNILLHRKTDGYFDSANFNANNVNRGYVTIQYVD